MIDFAIIGAGIVGLSTAMQLNARHPGASVLLLDKEDGVARHQSGRNSGVVHSGIYYPPGSLKARFCKAGAAATYRFCRDHGVACEQRGKLVVATDANEQRRLLDLQSRGLRNEVETRLLTADELREIEPHVVGRAALLVPSTSIVDYPGLCAGMAERLQSQGGELRFGSEVVAIEENGNIVRIRLADGDTVLSRYVVACAGLMADRLARMHGLEIDCRIVPYRGGYFRLPASKCNIVHRPVYPVPDPALPFLGIHLTPMIDGAVTVGPSAMQGWKREGYGRFNVSLRDTWDLLTYAGFWRAASRHLHIGLIELGSALWKPAYLRRVQRYCPGIELADLLAYPVGVRAQAVRRDGELVDDFLFAESPRSLHVCNAPSPAATSALPIGAYLCDRIDAKVRRC